MLDSTWRTDPVRVRVIDFTSTKGRRRIVSGGGVEATFEILGPDALDLPPNLDMAAAAMIFPAMRAGRDLHIEGPVSARLQRNLAEFSDAWSVWLPRLYRPVSVSADRIEDDAPPSPRRGVVAFSGGADSAFVMARHAHGLAGARTTPPAAAVLVHGFDIPLDQPEAFDVARRNAEAMLAPYGAPLIAMRTNWRTAASLRGNWANEFASGVAAALHFCAGVGNVGLFGADEDYSTIKLPWGSNPVTNHLLGGGAFDFVTEGGGFTRTERIALVANHAPEMARRLRVCWEGPATGGNCGVCEKCVRTKMNFLANGHEPACFDRPLSMRDLARLTPRNAVQIGYLNDILRVARANGVNAWWTWLLPFAIAKGAALLPARAVGRAVKKRLSRTRSPLGAAGRDRSSVLHATS